MKRIGVAIEPLRIAANEDVTRDAAASDEVTDSTQSAPVEAQGESREEAQGESREEAQGESREVSREEEAQGEAQKGKEESDDDLDLASLIIKSEEPVDEKPIKKKRKLLVPIFLASAALTMWAVSKLRGSTKKEERRDPPWISLGLRRIG